MFTSQGTMFVSYLPGVAAGLWVGGGRFTDGAVQLRLARHLAGTARLRRPAAGCHVIQHTRVLIRHPMALKKNR